MPTLGKIKDTSLFWKYGRCRMSKTSTSKLNTRELWNSIQWRILRLNGGTRETSFSVIASRLNGLLRYCPSLHFWELDITPTINLGYLILKTQPHSNPDNSYLKLNTQQCIFIFLIYKHVSQRHSKPLLTTYNDIRYLPVLYQDSEFLEVSGL